jgi:hypothetical protein
MNIEDLIRAANPVRTSDLPAGDSPRAASTLDQIARERAAPAGPGRVRLSRRAWIGTLTAVALTVTAAGAAVAVMLSNVLGAPPRLAAASPHASPTHAPSARTVPRPPTHRATAKLPTARQVLLTAAEHVARRAASGPESGTYWRVRMVSGLSFPAGTAANPYDISLTTTADQWNPGTPGQKEWEVTRQLGAKPATAADAAAWRAAGAPATWRSGLSARAKSMWLGGFPYPWMDALAASTAAAAPTATWQVSDGTVGYIEGDLSGLNAAQFRQLPTSQAGIAGVLRGYYAQLSYCIQHPRGCSTKDQVIWAEAVMLLQDPVSPQVRSATFKVMAALPGVRVLGLMTDPLGRTGYALAPGGQSPNADPENYNPLQVILIDPQTGSYLATEEIGPMPRSVRCLSFDKKNRCAGATTIGRSYKDQVDSYVAVISDGWTDAAPVLPPPSAWSGPTGFPGLPPLP